MLIDMGNGAVFGLVEHPMTEAPAGRTGDLYVSFPGCAGTVLAKWLDGEWRNAKGLPFKQPPERWYSMERVDDHTQH
jgi:hypothetical protein